MLRKFFGNSFVFVKNRLFVFVFCSYVSLATIFNMEKKLNNISFDKLILLKDLHNLLD